MTAISQSLSKNPLNSDTAKSQLMWVLVAIAALFLFAAMSHAAGTGGGTSMDELNTWLEGELGGSVGTTVGLVAFLSGLIGAVATRAFMPLIWGLGIGVTLGIFLDVVVSANGVGMPVIMSVAAGVTG
jgi:hypothetical protein